MSYHQGGEQGGGEGDGSEGSFRRHYADGAEEDAADDADDVDGKLLDRGIVTTTTTPTSSSYPLRKDGYYCDNYYPTCDTTTSHIQMGCIVLPIHMTLPSDNADSVHSLINSNHHDENEETSSPSYSIGKVSRISLVAAYPPPFPATSNSYRTTETMTLNDHDDTADNIDNTVFQQQQRLLQRYSGWYGTTSIHSASTTPPATTTTTQRMLSHSFGMLGYADSTISLNYRCPFFVVFSPSILSSLSNHDATQYFGMMNTEGGKRPQQHDHQCRKRNSRRRRQHNIITDLHYTMHLGPDSTTSATNNNNNIRTSIGTTLSSPDGTTQLRMNACSNNWLHDLGRMRSKTQMTAERRSDSYIISTSRDIFHHQPDYDPSLSWSLQYPRLPPVRAQCAMRLVPCSSLHSQAFLLTLSTMLDEKSTSDAYVRRGSRHRPLPDMTLCLGYGTPPKSLCISGERMLLTNANLVSGDSIVIPNDYYYSRAPANAIEGRDAVVVIPSSSIYTSANVKLSVEQRLSSSSKSSSSSVWHGTMEYLHAGRVLSFGTMMTRSFATSNFSRLGVGIRQSFYGNLFPQRIGGSNHGRSVSYSWQKWYQWWTEVGCATSWLFQLERGGVRLLVPVTLGRESTMIVSSWRTSLLGLFYASLASIIVDIIVCELLCGMTSRLRLCLLRLLLGAEFVEASTAPQECAAVDRENSGGRDDTGYHDELWLDEQLSEAREDALRQVNLMIRQARATTTNEEDTGGLVIIKAVYGVMDNESRQWLSRSKRRMMEDDEDIHNNLPRDTYTMDATTQLQFWVANSSLHLPKLPKKHLLGFYDVLAYIGDDGWVEIEEDDPGAGCRHSNTITSASTVFTRVLERFRKGVHWFWCETKRQRDLKVVLSIRYKFENRMYDVMFDDKHSVELPCRFAQEVQIP